METKPRPRLLECPRKKKRKKGEGGVRPTEMMCNCTVNGNYKRIYRYNPLTYTSSSIKVVRNRSIYVNRTCTTNYKRFFVVDHINRGRQRIHSEKLRGEKKKELLKAARRETVFLKFENRQGEKADTNLVAGKRLRERQTHLERQGAIKLLDNHDGVQERCLWRSQS
ncbi:uncharacterized protein C5L36_0A08990 [Pichia kudriavzevii]|uniref:Uncharacterized protein n=1 Tax=Pichia kudriavzevii TaxID=4909 RepID=A0A2U9QZ71_PICKU|nr:uncharacterized protein C5L36_0A08990 [Pichia kudriavzevii]AWU74305.1 hypothetical protein C5L36_0A08990 [Pichia kudriavzevii]